MSDVPYLGDTYKVTWTPISPSGTLFEIQDDSRTFKVVEDENDIPAGTRGNPEFTLGGKSNNVATMDGLDVEDGSPILALKPGHTGTLIWYQEGDASGMRKNTATARVKKITSTDLNFEDAAKWDIEWKLTSAIVTTLVAP